MKKVYYALPLLALVAACGSTEQSENANTPVAATEAKATPVTVATSAPTEAPAVAATQTLKVFRKMRCGSHLLINTAVRQSRAQDGPAHSPARTLYRGNSFPEQ